MPDFRNLTIEETEEWFRDIDRVDLAENITKRNNPDKCVGVNTVGLIINGRNLPSLHSLWCIRNYTEISTDSLIAFFMHKNTNQAPIRARGTKRRGSINAELTPIRPKFVLVPAPEPPKRKLKKKAVGPAAVTKLTKKKRKKKS